METAFFVRGSGRAFFMGFLPDTGVCFMGLLSRIFAGGRSADRGPAPLGAVRNRVTCTRYSVKGKNPATGRRKTVQVVSESTDPLDVVQKKSGLLPPYEVEVVQPQGPSEAQLKYASRLGFAFPPDATSKDATVFLTRAEDGVPLTQPAAPDWMVRYVISKGIFVPAYAGAGEVSAAYLFGSSERERAAFFCLRVFCTVHRQGYRVLEDATPEEAALFYGFADAYAEDVEFSRSLEHYGAADLPLDRATPLKRIKAFDLAAAYLKVKAGA